MSAAATVVLEMDAARDLHRYQRHARSGISPHARECCSAVVRALSTLVYSIEAERKASRREDEAT